MSISYPERRRYLIGYAFVLLMVASATLLHDTEIILPEIGALTAGTWIYQTDGWIQQPLKIFLAPSGTAIIGFLINQLPMVYPEKVLLGLLLMLVLLWQLRSNLAPAFATGLLPIIINATHWSFIVAILIFTLLLMLGVFSQQQYRSAQPSAPIHYRHMAIFTGLVIVWVGAVWLAGKPQMAGIPPVMVVFFEVLQKPSYSLKMAGKHLVALTGAASIGVLVHLALAPVLLATLVALPLVFGLLQLLKLKLPAAYAFPLLALVLPNEMFHMLPLTAFLAASFFLGVLVVLKRLNWRPAEQEEFND